jgi:hypothetical protein
MNVRFFRNLKVSAPIQRNNLFIQPVGGIFHHEGFHKHPKVTSPDGIWLRTELQSLRRLPRSEAIIFSVRTYLTNLSDLREEPESLEVLWDHVRNFPDDVSEYKTKALWVDAFEQFCRDTLGKTDPQITENGKGVGPIGSESKKTCPAGF